MSAVWCREILQCFRRQELLDWSSFQQSYAPVLREGLLPEDCPATAVFTPDTPLGEEHWKDLRKRVIEHVRL